MSGLFVKRIPTLCALFKKNFKSHNSMITINYEINTSLLMREEYLSREETRKNEENKIRYFMLKYNIDKNVCNILYIL